MVQLQGFFYIICRRICDRLIIYNTADILLFQQFFKMSGQSAATDHGIRYEHHTTDSLRDQQTDQFLHISKDLRLPVRQYRQGHMKNLLIGTAIYLFYQIHMYFLIFLLIFKQFDYRKF